MTCRTLPVKGERQRLPAGLRTQFFLAHIVRPTAAALTDAAAEDKHIDQAAVVHVEVEPVVEARPDDNHRATMGLIGVIGKFTCSADDMRAGDAGDLLRPGRGVGFHVIVAGGAVFIVQTAFQAIVGHGQIVNGGHQSGGAVGQLQAFGRQFVQQNIFEVDFVEVLRTFAAEVREADVRHFIMAAQQAQTQLNLFASFTVALFEVPFAFVAPAESEGTVRYGHVALLVKGDGFPFRIVLLTKRIHEVGGAQRTACGVITVALLEHHQHRHVGIAAHIIGEILARLIEMELTQHHMAHRQRHRGIGTLLRRQPQIAEFGDFGVVRGDRHGFSAFVADFGKEVGIRGTGLRHVGAPGDNVAGVIPVRRFGDVGLFAPGHRRSWRQVAVPVVEAQAGAADQRQITGAGGVGNHRHRRDRRETGHAVRTVSFDGIDVGGGNQLIHFLPGGADKPAATASLFEAFGFVGVFNNRGPCLNRIAMLNFRFPPHLHQTFTHQRVFQAVRAVQIPGVAGAARATAWFVVRQVRTGARVVSLLRFPGHQTVFHINLPAA